eukprot:SAG11_NODE_1282_length_5310_cov_24.980426_1_plen_203_part_00
MPPALQSPAGLTARALLPPGLCTAVPGLRCAAVSRLRPEASSVSAHAPPPADQNQGKPDPWKPVGRTCMLNLAPLHTQLHERSANMKEVRNASRQCAYQDLFVVISVLLLGCGAAPVESSSRPSLSPPAGPTYFWNVISPNNSQIEANIMAAGIRSIRFGQVVLLGEEFGLYPCLKCATCQVRCNSTAKIDRNGGIPQRANL